MNCGAKSCPPIAFYNYEKLDYQLDVAARVFLTSETEIDSLNKKLTVSKILDWFRADFGGKKGIRRIIKKYLNKDVNGYKIKFKPYNWDELLNNFSESPVE